MSIFKRSVCAAAVGVLALSLVGCAKKEKIENLDFTEAVISENAPNSGEWYTLKLNYPSSSDTASYMKKAADALGFSDFNEQDIIYNVYDPNNDINGDYTIDEMNSYRFDKLYVARCSTDDFYLEIGNNQRMVFNNRKLIRETVDDPTRINSADVGGWFPRYDGHIIKSYDVSDNEGLKDKYTLNGKDISILDGIEFTKKFIKDAQPFRDYSEDFTYYPIEISVYQQTETNYGYYFIFQTYFDGVPIDASNSGMIPESECSLFAPRSHVYLNDASSIAFFWTSAIYCDKPVSKEPCEIKIDFDQACGIVSKNLSQEHVFKIKSAGLMYCADKPEDPELNQSCHTIKPMWQFIITNTGMQYGTICVNVDAVTGEMFIRGVEE